jgi:hypothetical protein
MLLPKGFYQGTLIDIDQGEYWTWKFEIVHQGRKYSLKAFSSGKPYGKAKSYAEALLNRTLEYKEELDADLLTGMSAALEVSIMTKNGRQFNSIESLV